MGSSLIIYAQIAIVAAGNEAETVGETFPIMQQNLQENEVSLGVPKFEVPIEQPKQIVKKLTWWQKILKMFNFK